MNIYHVRSIAWKQEDDEAIPFGAADAEDAVEIWCRYQESNSNFCEGYPDGDEIEVRHANGSRTSHVVHTDWHASFYVMDLAA